MFVRIVRAALLGSMLVFPGLAFAQQADQQEQQRQVTAIPANVSAGLFAPDVQALLRLSDTFRSQCDRIAGDPRVRVSVSVAYSVDGGGRAQTTFRRHRSGTLSAEVELLFGENYRELLAHEFEHVLEQIDGVNLHEEAAARRAAPSSSACRCSARPRRRIRQRPSHPRRPGDSVERGLRRRSLTAARQIG